MSIVSFLFFSTSCDGKKFNRKKIKVGFIGKIDSLNPMTTKDENSWEVLNCTLNGLYRWNENWEKEPLLLKQIPSVKDGGITPLADPVIQIRYDLRDDIRWSDNSKITSLDVQYAYQLSYCPLYKNCNKELFSSVKSVLTNGDNRIDFKVLSQSFDINIIPLPLATLDKNLTNTSKEESDVVFSKNLIYSGPFIPVNINNRKAILKKNYNYFQPVTIENLELYFYHRESDLVADINKGKINVGYNLSLESIESLRGKKSLDIKIGVSQNESVLMFNFKNPVLNSKTFRKALLMAIKRESLSQTIYNSRIFALESWLPHKHKAFIPILKKYDNVSTKDIEKSLLTDTDFKKDNQGTLIYNKKPVELNFMTMDENKDAFEAINFIKGALERLGMKITITAYPKEEYDRYLRQRSNYDIALVDIETGPSPQLAALFKPPTYENDSEIITSDYTGKNFGGWQSKEDDEIIDMYNKALTPEEKYEILRKQQELFNENIPFIPLLSKPETVVFDSEIEGIRPRGFSPITWNAEKWGWR
jgi:peptide/nickel transport system substrate-binding protein